MHYYYTSSMQAVILLDMTRVTFCSDTWLRLQRVQNTAARLVTRKMKYEHITPTLVALHWIPFKFRCQYKLLLYAFKALHGLAPSYLGELIHF
jgi:hypothetical protein